MRKRYHTQIFQLCSALNVPCCIFVDLVFCIMSQFVQPSHLGHITLFLLEMIRILPQSSALLRNSDVIISKWSIGSGEYSDYFQKI